MKTTSITLQFVDAIPEHLAQGVLYICEKYSTTSHLCACGCGKEVALQLSPARWQLRRNGSTVTLHPSVGNWDFPCRSHYLIQKNRIVWAGNMSAKTIAAVKARDYLDQQRQIARNNLNKSLVVPDTPNAAPRLSNTPSPAPQESLWHTVRKFFGF